MRRGPGLVYPADILGIISRTSQSGATVVIGVTRRVGNLVFAGNGGDGSLSSRVVWHLCSLNSHVAEGSTSRVRVLARHVEKLQILDVGFPCN